MTSNHQSAGWSDRFLLGYEPMDRTHREFMQLAHGMLEAPAAAMEEAVTAFERHALAHFDEERAWMGSDFPGRECHIEEHDKVLDSVRQVRLLVASGEVEVARRLADSLLGWFGGHADFMDSALALWMVKKRFGGAPVVVKRGMALPVD